MDDLGSELAYGAHAGFDEQPVPDHGDAATDPGPYADAYDAASEAPAPEPAPRHLPFMQAPRPRASRTDAAPKRHSGPGPSGSAMGDVRYVKPFVPEEMLKGPHRIVFYGPSGSGKTSIITYFMYATRAMFPVVFVINGSEGDTEFYGQRVPPLLVHDAVTEEQLRLYVQQRRMAKASSLFPHCLAIFDDVSDDKRKLDIQPIRQMYKMGRGLWNATWIAIQAACDLQNWGRNNATLAVLMWTSNRPQRKTLFDNFGGSFEDFAEFEQYYAKICRGTYRAMVIPVSAARSVYKDPCYWFSVSPEWADDPPVFRMCHPEVWRWCESRTDMTRLHGRNIDDSGGE